MNAKMPRIWWPICHHYMNPANTQLLSVPRSLSLSRSVCLCSDSSRCGSSCCSRLRATFLPRSPTTFSLTCTCTSQSASDARHAKCRCFPYHTHTLTQIHMDIKRLLPRTEQEGTDIRFGCTHKASDQIRSGEISSSSSLQSSSQQEHPCKLQVLLLLTNLRTGSA